MTQGENATQYVRPTLRLVSTPPPDPRGGPRYTSTPRSIQLSRFTIRSIGPDGRLHLFILGQLCVFIARQPSLIELAGAIVIDHLWSLPNW